ncbi:uncharacterized protein MELLADRAFT_118208 [Melampsora larici-populina 98AG31]|uniref:Phosphatidic acid phosphatase type 2/haloperoxidase domain-containing protein n=1 Tax=Melampsora larici-populina (strain 98AG31 / pathotype 3-4-7) TaxID=747676 RepID=F4S690_MELLP|nr:uncharacterized protein MELLADRAFT_118208 [Melampsora larici-populina 98AG31]EGF99841.1 hypothetical protein MELLADRAFT_118208 [Melampsora larici-populina 98AG31]
MKEDNETNLSSSNLTPIIKTTTTTTITEKKTINVKEPTKKTTMTETTTTTTTREETNDSSMVQQAGTQPDHVYQSQMSNFRFKIRSQLLRSLNAEISILHQIQIKTKSPLLDFIMLNSSWLGSHSFFILTLPLCFWFDQNPTQARSHVYILSNSVYLTGFLKDYLCVPRPFSPPIKRLTISNHESEYGFPSTHSATSVTTIFMILNHLSQLNHLSTSFRWSTYLILFIYGILLIFGRIYCGMHSIQDVMMGCLIGFLVYVSHEFYLLDCLTQILEFDFMKSDFMIFKILNIPIMIISIGLFFTSLYPEPIDNCPCFEDSTAFLAVSIGIMISHYLTGNQFIPIRPFFGHNDLTSSTSNPLESLCIEGLKSILKIIIGLFIIFLWRLIIKESLSRLLPKLFKLFSPLIDLPRRHYDSTKNYSIYRTQLNQKTKQAGLKAKLIPSLLHLAIPDEDQGLKSNSEKGVIQDQNQNQKETVNQQTEKDIEVLKDPNQSNLKSRKNSNPQHLKPSKTSQTSTTTHQIKQWKPPTDVKHHDIDVLMRFIVYCGIGFLAAYALPSLFYKIGI